MKKIWTLLPILFLNLNAIYSSDIRDLFPKNNELKNCKMTDTVRVYKGDELFTYIDGGAEIYMEYGFKQVATTNYTDKDNNQLQVEIYDMKDSAAAYGAYTFYLNGEGKPFDAGTEGVFIDYFAAFWKGTVLTVISASDYKEVLVPMFNEIGSGISNKITRKAQPPKLISTLKQSGLTHGYIKYLKGAVGLSNVYRFIPNSAFKFNVGISFYLEDTQGIILEYETDAAALLNLSEALTKMKEADKETVFKNGDNRFSYSDYKSNFVNCVHYKNYILILIAKSRENCNLNLQKLVKVL